MTEATGSAGPRLRVSLDVSAVPERPVGAGQYILELAGQLSVRSDLDLVLFSRRSDRARWADRARGADIVAAVPDPRPVRLAWEQLQMGRLVGTAGSDVHHGPHYTMPRRCPVPAVVTIHDLSFFDSPAWHERTKAPFFRRAIVRAARHAAVVVCPSATTARDLERHCDVAAEVVVAPHGVDTERFRPDEPVPGWDSEQLAGVDVRLTAGRPMLVFVGTIEPRKDVPSLVAAFSSIASRHREALLVLVGGRGWGVDDVEAAIAASGLGRRIVQTGYVHDDAVPSLLRSATAVVYPSLYEGFGLPALEALACGAPLVTTQGTAMEEVAAGSAVIVPPGDRKALAEALDAALAGPEDDQGVVKRRALGFDVVARHTWERSAELHVGAYRRAAQQRD